MVLRRREKKSTFVAISAEAGRGEASVVRRRKGRVKRWVKWRRILESDSVGRKCGEVSCEGRIFIMEESKIILFLWFKFFFAYLRCWAKRV